MTLYVYICVCVCLCLCLLKGIFGAPVKVFVGTLDAVTHTGDAVAQGKVLLMSMHF